MRVANNQTKHDMRFEVEDIVDKQKRMMANVFMSNLMIDMEEGGGTE